MIRLSIRSKLFIAIFLACAVTVAGALGFFRFQFQRTYLEFVRQQETLHLQLLKQNLQNYYSKEGNWEQLRAERRQWYRLQWQIARQMEQDSGNIPSPSNNLVLPSSPSIHDIRQRTVLLDENHHYIQGAEQQASPDSEEKLEVNGHIIGYLGLYQRIGFNDSSEDARFLARQNNTLLLIAMATLLGSLLVALLLSRQLVKPIRRLRQSTKELADGNYTTRISDVGSDELGELSADFNLMAGRLQQNEQARRQWIMDIAHELRTPLSVLRGEIEAIQDGISAPDEPGIHSLHQETLHLQRLVEDLYTLSMSDSGALSYHKTSMDIVQTLRECIESFEPQIQDHGLMLDTQGISAQPIMLQADPQRCQQLFQNLLKNSLRYTDTPGKLAVSTQTRTDEVEIIVQDSAPAVPDESLPHLFERLYRVESSRNRATGGAGIGLSICHNIVVAHDGSIQASHSGLGGLKITIRLPLKRS